MPAKKNTPTQLELLDDPKVIERVCKLIEQQEMAVGNAFEACGIARRVSLRWRQKSENAWFDKRYPAASKIGHRAVPIGPRVERVLDMVSKGANVYDAFRAQGVSRKRAEKWLAEHPDDRNEIADRLADAKTQMVSTVALAAQKDWRAAQWWLERVHPEEYESALTRKQLAEKPSDPEEVASRLADAMAAMAATHAHQTHQLQHRIEHHQASIDEDDLDSVAEDRAEALIEVQQVIEDVHLADVESLTMAKGERVSLGLSDRATDREVIEARALQAVEDRLGDDFHLMQGSVEGAKIIKRHLAEEVQRLELAEAENAADANECDNVLQVEVVEPEPEVPRKHPRIPPPGYDPFAGASDQVDVL